MKGKRRLFTKGMLALLIVCFVKPIYHFREVKNSLILNHYLDGCNLVCEKNKVNCYCTVCMCFQFQLVLVLGNHW